MNVSGGSYELFRWLVKPVRWLVKPFRSLAEFLLQVRRSQFFRGLYFDFHGFSIAEEVDLYAGLGPAFPCQLRQCSCTFHGLAVKAGNNISFLDPGLFSGGFVIDFQY